MRDYDPTLGRYIQADPLGIMGNFNLYSYAASNPVYLIDPYGLQEVFFGSSTTLLTPRMPWWTRIPQELQNLPKVRNNLRGKDAADDIPSWCRGERPMVKESGKDWAIRMMDKRYGPQNWNKDSPEFTKIQKYGDRAFQLPDKVQTLKDQINSSNSVVQSLGGI